MGKTNNSKDVPYQELGKHLKKLRESRSETLAEVSGAVEIDHEALNSIESGIERPAEEILNLLISHFNTKESLASKLWSLAGYEDETEFQNELKTEINGDQQTVMVMPADARIAYTDMVHVMANNYGVVMNFMQATGPANQPLAVARIGMSKEHAKSVIEVLQKTLYQSEPKALPAPQTTQSKTNKKTRK